MQDFPDLEQALAALLAEQLDQRQDTSAAAHVRMGAASETAATELLHESAAGAGRDGAPLKEQERAGVTEHAGASASSAAQLPTANRDSVATHSPGDTAAASPPAAAGGAAAAAVMRRSGLGPESDARPPSLDLWGVAAHSSSSVLAVRGFVGMSSEGSADAPGNAAGAHASGAGADSLVHEHLSAGASTRTFRLRVGHIQTPSIYTVLCAQLTDCACAAGVTDGSSLPSSASPAAAQLRGDAGEQWLEDVFREVVAADSNGTAHSSGLPLTYAGAVQSSHSVNQPPTGDAVPPHDNFSFATHGDHRASGGVVSTLESSGDNTDLGAPAYGSSLEADGAVPVADCALRGAGSGQPFAVGSHFADGLATSGTGGRGGAAEGRWVSVSAVSEQYPAGGLQRGDDDGNSAAEAASWPLQAQTTSSGSLSTPMPRSATAGRGSGIEADAGLSSLLQPGLNSMPSAGGGLLDSILLGSPTRASPAVPPAASSPGFVHGIPRLNGGASGGGSPYPTGNQNAAGLAAAASFGAAPSGGGSLHAAGAPIAAGLAAAASFGVPRHGLSAGSGALGSASAPSRQPVTAGPARSPVAMGQGGPPGNMLPAGAAITSAQVSNGTAAHAPVRTAAASFVTSSAADGAAASHVTVADGSRGAAAHATSISDSLATGGLAAPHGVAGTVGTTGAQVRCSSAEDLYPTGAAAGPVPSPAAGRAAARQLAVAEGGQGGAYHVISNEDGMATGRGAASHGVGRPAAGLQLHGSVLAAPGARRRDTDAAASEPSQMDSAQSADLAAELQQQVLLFLQFTD